MDPTWEELDDRDENNEDTSSFEAIPFMREGLIFLIDASEDMFDDSEETSFHCSVKCAYTTLKNKIISSEKDLVSVILFGTDKSKNSLDFKHIYVFQELEQPGAEKVIQMKNLLNCTAETFKEEYGHSKDFSIAEALWTCSTLFSACQQRLSTRRILLFTNCDSPHADNPTLEKQAKTKAKDLFELGIEVNVMHMRKEDRRFDINKFYKDIMYLSDEEYNKLPDPAEKFDELLTRIRTKNHKKHSLGHVNFYLGDDVKMAVSIFSLVRSMNKPYSIKLSKVNNAELKTMTKHYRGDTAEILLPSDLKKCQEYAGKKIYMDMDELRQMKYFGESGLTLLGFKPIACLKEHHHLRPTQFIYPDESRITGSIRLFYALLQQCHKKQYAPICKFICRNNDTPKLVALIPQEEELDDHGIQEVPHGFHVVFLPFMEDMRKLNLRNKQKPKEQLVDKAKEIIKKLQFRFHPESFENPVLQQHWRNIEALALDEDAPDEIIDYTMPDYKTMEQRAGKLMEEFKSLAFSDNYESIVTGKKRNLGAACGGTSKRSKLDDTKVTVDVQKEAQEGRLDRLTVNVLKEFCKSRGIKCGSRKAEIIGVINKYFHVD
ncbi:ATP-dependent DNA helicase 2 subunit 1-like [Centruroides sculpturatus]|uniref:ATP-dependent DNA helicase 2 subunit 1-like n=1 Tax=Centruroides sculpturatus TaxID=218467 RepID=UPI000C6D831E|nr:ATP-dependent DNA helicase 2 subunit 1-like [Centruroides sculpturatus]